MHTLIPAMLALVILVGGPFGLGKRCETDPRAGLVCYCCLDAGKNCTMISCAGCCGSHSASVADGRAPDMLPEFFSTTVPVTIIYGDGEAVRSPEVVYLEVPDKPPKRV